MFNQPIKVILLSGLLLTLSSCNTTSPPKLEGSVVAMPSSVEFARVAEGARKQATIHLINKSKSVVNVSSVGTSCGCTTANIKDGVLKPGQAVALQVNYNSKGFSGPQEKKVDISFADGSPDLTVPVRANVYSLVKLSPAEIDFGNAKLGQAKTVTVEMKRLDGGALPMPRFAKTREFEMKAERRAANKIALQVTLRPTRFAGPRFGVLRLQTGLDALPQVELPLSATVAGQLRVTPNQANFGAIDGVAEKKINIASNGRALPNLKVKTVPAGFNATLIKQSNGYDLTVRNNKTAKSGIVNEAIVLESDDKMESSVVIPLLAVVE